MQDAIPIIIVGVACLVIGFIAGLSFSSNVTLKSISKQGHSLEGPGQRVVGHVECKVGDRWVKEKE